MSDRNLVVNKQVPGVDWGKAMLMIVDVITVVASTYLALMIRFSGGARIPDKYVDVVVHTVLIDVAILIIFYVLLKVYSIMLRWFSIYDMWRIVVAEILFLITEIIYRTAFGLALPRSCYVIEGILIFSITMFSRSSVRLYMSADRRAGMPGSGNSGGPTERIIIIGAGNAADALYRDILKSSDSNVHIACFIDGDPSKWGKTMHNTPVFGNIERLDEAIKKYDATEIIIAIPSMTGVRMAQLAALCADTGLKVKVLPPLVRSLSDMSNLFSYVRDIDMEDLLGRDAVTIDDIQVSTLIRNKKILVTGGAGSIGSELCRQIVGYDPAQLIIVDINENDSYYLLRELQEKYPSEKIKLCIGSVRDEDRLSHIFAQYEPDIVYHAAAHKHVPLMEYSPCEAIKNNCMGTYNAASMAAKWGAERFILISTDKAVKPTSLMGASKRICEMIVQYFASRVEGTVYSAVRFGNVLGSNGSVVPIFLKQIESGGPVTVTDKRMTRYFMIIPEAVSLVLESSILANDGEIFVLDMGNPVKIYDMAEKLIMLKGLIPGKDIEIKETGLRPGEKLYEELLMKEEGLMSTCSDMIHVARPIEMDYDEFYEDLMELFKEAQFNAADIKEKVAEICGTYTIDRRYDHKESETWERSDSQTYTPTYSPESTMDPRPGQKPLKS